MSVYYKEKPEYLDACLESIANQTLLPNEIILVEDGPLTNELNTVIQNWKEKTTNIKSVILKENSGLAIALNTGLKNCSNNIVARMDTDDTCVPDRFEKQLAILNENSSIVLLGGQVAEYDEGMKKLIGYRRVPLSQKEIIKFSKRRSPFNHPTVVFKKDIVESVGGYPKHLKNWQDYALWTLILTKGYNTQNINDILVKMRTGNELFNRRSGLKYLKYELEAYNFVFNNGLINRFEYSLVSIIKVLTRLLPKRILKIIYKVFFRSSK